MTMSGDDQTLYQQRVARRQREEMAEFENNEVAKRQREMDFHWQCRLDVEAALRDDAEGSTGSIPY
jgi:hypothetical protein